MPFEMVANRLLYRPDEARECKKGEVFTVETETEKNRLVRSKRASLHGTTTASIKSMKPPKTETRAAPIVAKVMKAEDPAPAATPPGQSQESPPAASTSSEPEPGQHPAPSADNNPTNPTPSRSNRYRRHDLRSED